MAAKRTVIVSGGHTWHKISVQQPNWPSLHTNKPRLAPLSDQCPRQPLSPFLCTRSQFLPFLSYSNLLELPSADPISDYEMKIPSCMHWIQLSDFLCPSHGWQPAPLGGSPAWKWCTAGCATLRQEWAWRVTCRYFYLSWSAILVYLVTLHSSGSLGATGFIKGHKVQIWRSIIRANTNHLRRHKQ